MASGSLTPLFLSESVNGESVQISAASAPGTALHVTPSGSAFLYDVSLTVANDTAVTHIVTVAIGGTGTGETMRATLNKNSHTTFPRVRVTGGLSITAWHDGSSGDVLGAWAIVNRMEN